MTTKQKVLVAAAVATLATAGMAMLLINIVERKQEARTPYFQTVQIKDDTQDPAEWGKNFPLHYDAYKALT